MINKILILTVLYLIFTMDFSCFKSFDSSCMESMKDRLGGMIRWIVEFIDKSFIPFVNNLFETMDKEKSLVGNTIDYLKKWFNVRGQ